MRQQALLEVARATIALRRSGENPALLSSKEQELTSCILGENDSSSLYQVIDENAQLLALPMDILSLIFRRFNELGERTTRVLEWYASMIMFYGDPSDWPAADELLAEAKALKSIP